MDENKIQFLQILAILIFWVIIFTLGVNLSSGTYAEQIGNPEVSLLSKVKALVGIMITWTWSNLFLLCCLASAMGELGWHRS